jgi:tRNA A-37 threonylcarbamoyl transferase component Bud32
VSQPSTIPPSPAAPARREELPARIDRYEILRVLGRGAMGKVYLARDTMIGRLAALKTFLVNPAMGEDTEELRKRLMREARAAGAVSHPNIVTIYDVLDAPEGGDGDAFFLAMEYVEGRSLDAVLKEGDTVDPLPIVRQVAAALDHLHKNGIVHRDIKPANILLASDGTVKLTDFGVARPSDPNATQDTMLFGTPMYMAPEVLRGKTADARSEVFALGVLVYEMVTRTKPFTGRTVAEVTNQILREPHQPPSAVVPGFPAPVAAVLDRALAKDPADRFPSAGAMFQALRDAMRLQGDPQSDTLSFAPPTAATVRLAGWRAWLRPGRVAMVALAALSVLLATLLWRSSLVPPEPVVDPQQAAREASFLMLVAEGQRLLAGGDPAGAAVVFATAERLGMRSDEARALRESAEAAARQSGAEPAPMPAAERPVEAMEQARRVLSRDRDRSAAAAVVASAEQVLSGESPPPPSPSEAAPARLTLRLDTESPRGVVILYVGGQQVLNAPWSFFERRGMFSRKGVPGTLERSVEVAAGAQTVRVFLTRAGEPAQLLELTGELAPGGEGRLEVALPATGDPSGQWVPVGPAPDPSQPGAAPAADPSGS